MAIAKKETDPANLFYLYQTLREEIAKAQDIAVPFKFKGPNGEVVEAHSLKDAQSKLEVMAKKRLNQN